MLLNIEKIKPFIQLMTSQFKLFYTFRSTLLISSIVLLTYSEVQENTACNFPGCPSHGSVYFSTEIFVDGTIASYYCERGFELLGPARRMCERGKWLPEGIPFCVINVATGKASMQISTDGSGNSQKAIDSSTSLLYNKNTCSLTKEEKNPWWYVNLLEPYLIQLVRIDFGKPCCGSSPATIIIRVGNNRPDLGKNPICNKFVGYIQEGEPLFLPCNPPMPGAFVSVHLEVSIVSLSMCEAFVYTDQALPIERCPSFRDIAPGGTSSYNGKCYIFYNKKFLNFDSAQYFCESRNGTLISEVNPALQGFISWELWRRHRTSSSSLYWVGIVRNKTSNYWKSVDGREIFVTFWNSVEGHGECAKFDGSKGWLWTIQDCKSKLNFICQHQPNACGNPEQPPNSTINSNKSFEVGSKIYYHCDPGHLLVGSSIRECLETGFYDVFAPVCKYIDCDSPASILFGSFDLLNKTTTYNSYVRYSCNTGFELIGKNLLMCDMDGRWNGPPPNCQMIECETLSTANTNFTVEYTNGTLYLSQANIKCKSGYILEGQNLLTCKGNGQWDYNLPKCNLFVQRKFTITEPTTRKTSTLILMEETKTNSFLREFSNSNTTSKEEINLIIQNEKNYAVNDNKLNSFPQFEITNKVLNDHQQRNSSELSFLSVISVFIFTAFILISASITSFVIYFKRMKLTSSHYKQNKHLDCKTITSLESSMSSSTNGLNRYYRQAWENLHEFANRKNFDYSNGITPNKECLDRINKRHHHHHHKNANICHFVSTSKRQ